MIRAGQYRERVEIFRRVITAETADGSELAEWQSQGRLWCNMRETPGKESIAAGRLEGTATATLRFRAGATAAAIGEGDAIRDAKGRVWQIRGRPAYVERDRALDFKAEQGAAVEAPDLPA